MMRGRLRVLGLTLALGACATSRPRHPHHHHQQQHQQLVAATPYATGPLPPRAKIFLVAGGIEVANFAAEVVAQRRLWLARGYAPDEIACYWAHPFPAALRADRAQYLALAADLRPCYRASAELLRAHLLQASRAEIHFVYLYVTSHGDVDIMPEGVPEDSLLPSERALFEQYVIQLGGGVGAGVDPGTLALAMRSGADPTGLVFSPRLLRDLLLGFPAATPKIVVLQACHSGGFLDEARPERRADTIASVPRLTAIAAARFDRTSFGCDSGAEMTYFGEVYTALLAQRLPADPTTLDWAALYRALRADITRIEREVDVRPSLPVFLTTP